jgi:predicted transcriptional regulator
LEGKKPPCKELMMEILSREYGWLPSQIKTESNYDIQNYWNILQERALIEKQKSKRK